MRATNAAVTVSVRPSDPEQSASQFAADVAFYLNQTPRQLPSRYLYDPLGSSLFEAIRHLPWYRISGAETALLARHGAALRDAQTSWSRARSDFSAAVSESIAAFSGMQGLVG